MNKVNCIDVSEFQQNIDFAKLKNYDINFVIIRAGYGREISQKDSEFERHYENAKSQGLKIGSYWYSYATTVDDAEKEAIACLECIKNKNFDLPIFYDLEDHSQITLGKENLTKIAEKFCETISSNGFKAGVYANLNWFNNYLDYDYLKSKYPIWLAQYHTENSLDCDIWQNSDNGKFDGINCNVDTNIIYNFDFNNNKTLQLENKNLDNNNIKTDNNTEIIEKVDVFYRVQCGKNWLPAVKNLTDYAGIIGKSITGVAIKVSQGEVKYQVHILGGDWLPEVSGFNISDFENGYAGNGKEIDAIRIFYKTPKEILEKTGKYLKAKYRVSPLRKNYYDFQLDTEKNEKMDGYAGYFGKKIDRLQIAIE